MVDIGEIVNNINTSVKEVCQVAREVENDLQNTDLKTACYAALSSLAKTIHDNKDTILADESLWNFVYEQVYMWNTIYVNAQREKISIADYSCLREAPANKGMIQDLLDVALKVVDSIQDPQNFDPITSIHHPLYDGRALAFIRTPSRDAYKPYYESDQSVPNETWMVLERCYEARYFLNLAYSLAKNISSTERVDAAKQRIGVFYQEKLGKAPLPWFWK